MSIVYASIAKDHYGGVSSALKLSSFYSKVKSSKSVVIKVNFVSAYSRLSSTPIEAVKALLDEIFKVRKKEVIIAETPAIGDFRYALKEYGYLKLKDSYNVDFLDISDDDYEEFYVWNSDLRRDVRIRVSKTILNSDCLISITRPKTHDTVIVTLTIKNVAVGAILPSDRGKIHKGYKPINISIAYLATFMLPKIGIIDGYIGMEGNGPARGDPKSLGVSLVGFEPVALDSLVTYLMGFEPANIGYLYYLWKWGYGNFAPDGVKVIGVDDIKSFRTKFRPHVTYNSQLKWRLSKDEERIAFKDLDIKIA